MLHGRLRHVKTTMRFIVSFAARICEYQKQHVPLCLEQSLNLTEPCSLGLLPDEPQTERKLRTETGTGWSHKEQINLEAQSRPKCARVRDSVELKEWRVITFVSLLFI